MFTALAKDPQQRFEDVQAFAAALEDDCLPIVQASPEESPEPTLPMAVSVLKVVDCSICPGTVTPPGRIRFTNSVSTIFVYPIVIEKCIVYQ